MDCKKLKKGRKVPKLIGLAAVDALEKAEQKGKMHEPWVAKLKAVALCYLKGKTGEDIAAELGGYSTQTICAWFSEIVGPYCREDDEQAIVRAVHIIEGMTSACFSFEDVYWESTRWGYVDGVGSHPSKDESTEDEQVKQGRKEFRSIMLRAGINLACFVGRDGKLHFNEDGRELAIHALNNRTWRKEEDQDRAIFEVYQDIRAGFFQAKHSGYYEWMLQKACANLRDIQKAYPDFVFYNEEDIREEFWRNTCRRNKGFDAFPGISCLGELPRQLSDGWFLVFDEFLFLDSIILKEFTNSKNWDNQKMVEQKEFWINYLMCVFAIRNHENEKITAEINQLPPEDIKDLQCFIDYLFSYENRFEDGYEASGISLAKEEKWASREIAEDKRLRSNLKAMKRNIEENTLNEDSTASRAARIFVEWEQKFASISKRFSVEDVLEYALELELKQYKEKMPDDR